MDTGILKEIGLTDNEIQIYLVLLKMGSLTAHSLSQKTGIYRSHVYDKVEQLMDKGLATQVYNGAKKFFQATPPEKLKYYLEDKRKELDVQEEKVDKILPDLNAMTTLPREETKVAVFKGKEGLKYFLKDIVKTAAPVCISGLDDAKYEEAIPVFMKQHFRDLNKKGIKERVITLKDSSVFLYDSGLVDPTTYRFLDANQFNPTNTFVYANKVVIVTWGTPITAIMIENENVAATYLEHFNHLWRIASTTV